MIDRLKQDNLQYFWLSFHLLLGAVGTYFPTVLILWIYLLLFLTLLNIAQEGNSKGAIHFFLAYYIGMEILARSIKASPIVPYESGKYFMFILIAYGIMIANRSRRSPLIGWIILILSVPSLIMLPSSFTYKNIVFNYLGILNLSLAVIYFIKISIAREELLLLFRLVIYSIIPLLVSITLKTPDFEDIQFSTAANFKTTGGFGSNQVSTLLSLAFLLIGFCYITGQKIFKSNIVSLILFCVFFFRALLTFSRGGVLGAIVVLFLVFIMLNFHQVKMKRKKSSGLIWTIVIFGILASISIYVNRLTDNVLLLRYQGETTSTLMGLREKDISLITSSRYDVFLSDLEIWYDNFFFGVGPGMSAKMRDDFIENVSAHVEISRLLSEHGLMGLFISIILLLFPVFEFFKARDSYSKLFKLCLFGYAIFTSFHSAMRTNVTPFLFGLATVTIYEGRYYWYKRFIYWKSTYRAWVQSNNNRSAVGKTQGTI